jgi:hypothetical protein
VGKWVPPFRAGRFGTNHFNRGRVFCDKPAWQGLAASFFHLKINMPRSIVKTTAQS